MICPKSALGFLPSSLTWPPAIAGGRRLCAPYFNEMRVIVVFIPDQ